MTLLLQVIGVLLVAAVARAVVGSDRRLRVESGAVTAVAVVLVGFGALDGAWVTTRSLLTERSANARLSPSEYQGRGGTIFSAREDFLTFVDSRVPRAATVHLACACSDERDWISWRLSPRRFTERPQDADWLVFYRVQPQDADVPAGAYERLVRFEPGFELARVRR
ncbi:MAG: hypothetical protein ACR2H2_13410 [Solirubrobacteraceae bacterium]